MKNKIAHKIVDYQIETLNDYLIADQSFVLPNDMLKKVDQMSMAHALEVRVPFLDHHVVEFANSLPSEWKFSHINGKIILKDAFKTELPDSILNRRKKGFEIPLQMWLHEQMDELFNEAYFTEKYIEDQSVFNFKFVQNLKSDWKNGRVGENIYMVWAILSFQHWYHHHIFNK